MTVSYIVMEKPRCIFLLRKLIMVYAILTNLVVCSYVRLDLDCSLKSDDLENVFACSYFIPWAVDDFRAMACSESVNATFGFMRNENGEMAVIQVRETYTPPRMGFLTNETGFTEAVQFLENKSTVKIESFKFSTLYLNNRYSHLLKSRIRDSMDHKSMFGECVRQSTQATIESISFTNLYGVATPCRLLPQSNRACNAEAKKDEKITEAPKTKAGLAKSTESMITNKTHSSIKTTPPTKSVDHLKGTVIIMELGCNMHCSALDLLFTCAKSFSELQKSGATSCSENVDGTYQVQQDNDGIIGLYELMPGSTSVFFPKKPVIYLENIKQACSKLDMMLKPATDQDRFKINTIHLYFLNRLTKAKIVTLLKAGSHFDKCLKRNSTVKIKQIRAVNAGDLVEIGKPCNELPKTDETCLPRSDFINQTPLYVQEDKTTTEVSMKFQGQSHITMANVSTQSADQSDKVIESTPGKSLTAIEDTSTVSSRVTLPSLNDGTVSTGKATSTASMDHQKLNTGKTSKSTLNHKQTADATEPDEQHTQRPIGKTDRNNHQTDTVAKYQDTSDLSSKATTLKSHLDKSKTESSSRKVGVDNTESISSLHPTQDISTGVRHLVTSPAITRKESAVSIKHIVKLSSAVNTDMSGTGSTSKDAETKTTIHKTLGSSKDFASSKFPSSQGKWISSTEKHPKDLSSLATGEAGTTPLIPHVSTSLVSDTTTPTVKGALKLTTTDRKVTPESIKYRQTNRNTDSSAQNPATTKNFVEPKNPDVAFGSFELEKRLAASDESIKFLWHTQIVIFSLLFLIIVCLIIFTLCWRKIMKETAALHKMAKLRKPASLSSGESSQSVATIPIVSDFIAKSDVSIPTGGISPENKALPNFETPTYDHILPSPGSEHGKDPSARYAKAPEEPKAKSISLDQVSPKTPSPVSKHSGQESKQQPLSISLDQLSPLPEKELALGSQKIPGVAKVEAKVTDAAISKSSTSSSSKTTL